MIGILRLVGASQNSGFNSPQTHVSILSRMVADMSEFGVTYLVLAAGAFCALGLVWRLEPWYPKRLVGDPKRRASVMGAMWTLSAAAYLGYATAVRHHRRADVLHPPASLRYQRGGVGRWTDGGTHRAMEVGGDRGGRCRVPLRPGHVDVDPHGS